MTTLSKEQYLKKYLSGDAPPSEDASKKKKKKKKPPTAEGGVPLKKKVLQNVKIVDETPVLVPVGVKREDDDEMVEEDLPVVIDEDEKPDPDEIQILERPRAPDEDGGWTVVAAPAPAISIKKEPMDQGDFSPPRHRADAEDISPLRRPIKSEGQDISPPRKPQDDDISPPRRRTTADDDISPPRRRNTQNDFSPPRRRVASRSPERTVAAVIATAPPSSSSTRVKSASPPRIDQMSSGAKAGLRTASDVVQDYKKRKLDEDRNFAAKNPKDLGKDAQTIYRDKHGRRLEALEELVRQQEGAKPSKSEEQQMEWGKGLVQKKQREEEKQREEAEKFKPLARYADDEDLNKMRREQIHWDDPMARFMLEKREQDDKKREKKEKKERKKEKKEKRERKFQERLDAAKAAGEQVDPEKLREQMEKERKEKKANKKEKKALKAKDIASKAPKKYQGAWPANRFNIAPGHRWDGIDRSNGFEKQLLTAQSEKIGRAEQAYKWSVEDM